MIFFHAVLLVIVVACLKYRRYNLNYISIQQTNTIKGIFIWLVFIGHILPYIVRVTTLDSIFDKLALNLVNVLQQFVVVPFLFYSGYGVTNSIKNKGISYVNSIPRKRILNTMLNFAVAVSVFIGLNLIFSIPIGIKQVLLSFVCWDSVGNSNWYIFTICFCYLSSYISYKLFGYSKQSLFANVTIIVLYVLILSRFKESWWYNTCFAYSIGVIYCYYKEQFEKIINRNYLYSFSIGGGYSVDKLHCYDKDYSSTISFYEYLQYIFLGIFGNAFYEMGVK